ncbi:Stk1 family PASTA domain-containing Ser/Thr kinase [Clostridium sp. NSJ-6]|uniref:non-specific serine/threonine protein kinase n=1 Tax=Clostridium hominis TaxID=2763036 RepID=A0ABR7DAR6_9CLOT|nr:Stk1 family PASTA domain-containing Ser/Thr kinase [Clostridium hominis]MBC5628453.1 Stk1 family PASTA domain-containing Ser/Thr kinase [Clostridium hominis]
MIGMILGDRYELLEVIGEGGMAVVYKARDKKLNRLVAVKILKKEFADNKDISEKFKKEATAIANLSDMNIVNVLDVGHEDEDNTDYFVMELVEGKTLKEIIVSNGKIGWSTASTIAIQVAKALDCAHRNGIIHRDVKPQNILITEHGDVKVTDFGIAKSATSSTITNTTTIMGSAHYLSPEQAKGTFIDFRTDLYSLGIVLYEMVTAKLPFDGESPVTIALKHIQEEPVAPKTLNDTIPDSLNSFILKAISKDPISRYQTSKEMIADLQKIKDNPMTIIQAPTENDGGRTIVMSPIKTDINPKPKKVEKVNLQNKMEEEEEEEEDFDDDYFKKKNKKKGKGLIIGGVIAVLLLVIVVFTTIFIGGNEVKQVKVPNIIGKSFDEAKKEIEALGLKLEREKTENSDKPDGEILRSDPAADTMINKGSIIKVVVSGGVEKVTVPNLRDYEENVIKQYLDSKGLKYEINYEFNDNVEKGYYVSQDPKAGTEIAKEDTIYVTISKGPEVKLVKVKNYIGYNINDAKADLESQKFIVNIMEQETDRQSENGKVLEQPVKDIEVKEGTTIELYVGKYVEPTTDITQFISEGMLLSDAIVALDSNNIKYTVEGGTPPSAETNQYKVIAFTPSIKDGEQVKIQIQKIESLPTDTPPENPPQDNETTTQNTQ